MLFPGCPHTTLTFPFSLFPLFSLYSHTHTHIHTHPQSLPAFTVTQDLIILIIISLPSSSRFHYNLITSSKKLFSFGVFVPFFALFLSVFRIFSYTLIFLNLLMSCCFIISTICHSIPSHLKNLKFP